MVINLYMIPFARYLSLAICLVFLAHISASAQITGTVFRDFNANATREAPGEIGVGGITVTVTGANGVSTTTSTAAANLGTYSIAPTGTAPYVVQFANIPAGYFDGPVGSGSGSSVQFVATATASVNLGINYPSDYSQANPFFLVPCYVNGDPTNAPGTAGNAGATGALIAIPYTDTGNAPSGTVIATTGQVGSVFGWPTCALSRSSSARPS